MISYNSNKRLCLYLYDVDTYLKTLVVLEDLLYSGGSVVVILSDLENK